MTPEDQAQIADMINKGVTAGISEAMARLKPPAPTAIAAPVATLRSAAEIGSPEFAEDRTQINSLNNKFMLEATIRGWNTEFIQQRTHADELNHRALKSIDELLALQTKVNAKFFEGVDDRARLRDQWNYITAYDLSNPNTLSTSDDVRGGVTPQNRAIDAATAQSVLDNTTLQDAIGAAVASAIDAEVPTLQAAIGAAIAAALENVTLKPAAPTAA